MSSRTIIRWTTALALLALPLSACSDDYADPVGNGSGMASVDLVLIDAPGDVDRAYLDIGEVYFQGGVGGRTTLVSDYEGWIEVTALTQATAELVSGVDVEPGAYSQLRILLDAAIVVSEEGEVYVFGSPSTLPDGLEQTGDLQCPSCAQTGIKVLIASDDGGEDVELEEGENTIVLDFDVSQSFGHAAGNSGKWVMHPVIQGGTFKGALEAGFGRIEGTVALQGGGDPVSIPACPVGTPRGLADLFVTATAQTLLDAEGEAVVRNAVVASDGTYRLNLLAPDTYTLGGEIRLDFLGFDLVVQLTADAATQVVAGGQVVTGADLTVTSASCEVDVGGE